MLLTVNGKEQSIEPGSSLLTLFEQLELEGTVAVERNGAIVRRDDHQSTLLCDGDRLEIVHFVGGG
jgi:thiamine biosynthesis protein ThiS